MATSHTKFMVQSYGCPGVLEPGATVEFRTRWPVLVRNLDELAAVLAPQIDLKRFWPRPRKPWSIEPPADLRTPLGVLQDLLLEVVEPPSEPSTTIRVVVRRQSGVWDQLGRLIRLREEPLRAIRTKRK